MPTRIVDWCTERGLRAPVSRPVVVRSIIESLAEATAIGNVLVQARTLGAVGSDLLDLREIVAASQALVDYAPR